VRCFILARVKYNNSDVNLLGRLIRSEAVGDGEGPLCTSFSVKK